MQRNIDQELPHPSIEETLLGLLPREFTDIVLGFINKYSQSSHSNSWSSAHRVLEIDQYGVEKAEIRACVLLSREKLRTYFTPIPLDVAHELGFTPGQYSLIHNGTVFRNPENWPAAVEKPGFDRDYREVEVQTGLNMSDGTYRSIGCTFSNNSLFAMLSLYGKVGEGQLYQFSSQSIVFDLSLPERDPYSRLSWLMEYPDEKFRISRPEATPFHPDMQDIVDNLKLAISIISGAANGTFPR